MIAMGSSKMHMQEYFFTYSSFKFYKSNLNTYFQIIILFEKIEKELLLTMAKTTTAEVIRENYHLPFHINM